MSPLWARPAAPTAASPTPATAAARRVFHPLTVSGVERLCDDAVAVSFAVPPELAATFDFRAGQSLTLRRFVDGQEFRRTYSICAAVGTPPRVGVREVPGGVLSSWLTREVRPGQQIDVLAPSGRFSPDPTAGGRHVLIAAGSGITPVLSIAASLLARPDTELTLIYGNRRTTTVMFGEELADLKDSYGPRLDLVHVLSREPRDVELFSGRLDAQRIRNLLAVLVPVAEVDHFWLCGPLGMVDAAQQVLRDLGVPDERVHVELFYVDAPPPQPLRHPERGLSGPSSEVTVLLDGRASTLTLPRDESILDAAQRDRADLPFACKGGVCGTCRARITDGEVDMRRNYALERQEVADGFVLTCQSFPVSDRVTVDYDA